ELTDGYVPTGIIPMLALAVKADMTADVADLLRVGLLTTQDGGYDLHGFLHWQESRADVDARRQAGRIAGRRSGEVRRAMRGLNDSLNDPLNDPLENRSTISERN